MDFRFIDTRHEQAATLQRALESGRPALVNIALQWAISPRAEAAIPRRRAATY
jgi:hypothetical protein